MWTVKGKKKRKKLSKPHQSVSSKFSLRFETVSEQLFRLLLKISFGSIIPLEPGASARPQKAINSNSMQLQQWILSNDNTPTHTLLIVSSHTHKPKALKPICTGNIATTMELLHEKFLFNTPQTDHKETNKQKKRIDTHKNKQAGHAGISQKASKMARYTERVRA